MDDEFKIEAPKKDAFLSQETIETEAERLINIENGLVSNDDAKFELIEDLVQLIQADQEGNLSSILLKLYDVKTFLAQFKENDNIFDEIKEDILILLIKYIQLDDNRQIQKIALEIIAILCEKSKFEIFQSLIDLNLQKILVELMVSPIFEAKNMVFISYGFIILRNPKFAETFFDNVNFPDINDAAVELHSQDDDKESVNFFYFQLAKSGFVPPQHLIHFISLFFFSLANHTGVRYTLASINSMILFNQITPQDLEQSFILQRIMNILTEWSDLLSVSYVLRILGNIAEKYDAIYPFDIPLLMEHMKTVKAQWIIGVFCDSMSKIASKCADDAISMFISSDILTYLYDLQQNDFQNMMSSIFLTSTLLLRIQKSTLIDITTPELINSLIVGISSESNKIIEKSLRAILRILETSELSFIISQSELNENDSDFEELDQTPEIEELAAVILDKLPLFFGN